MRINVTRSSMPDFEEFCQEIRPLWDSHWLTNNGEKLLELQSRLEAYLDVGHLSLFTNGHLALEALLEALGPAGRGHHHALHLCLHHACPSCARGLRRVL